jgi:hypothetical protein
MVFPGVIPWSSPAAHRPTRIRPCDPLSQPRCRAGATFSIALSLTIPLALSLAKLFERARLFDSRAWPSRDDACQETRSEPD